MAAKLIDRYVEGNRRFAAWYMRAYVPWGRRHQPYSFAIAPVVLSVGFVAFWLELDLSLLEALLYFLVPFAILFLLSAGFGVWRGKRRRDTRQP